MTAICVGGTFDPLHDGHKALLRKALSLGNVLVGLTSDEFASRLRLRWVRAYSVREQQLKLFFENCGREVTIVPIDDPYGPSITGEFEAIVVSPETRSGADKINGIRSERGLKPLRVYEIPWVLAQDGKPISSTRIVSGEIDVHGRCLTRLPNGSTLVI